MTEQIEMAIDVATRTTRGRSCPRCGGKINPSIRYLPQSSGDPNSVFAAWQCERCSYEEVFARPSPAAARQSPAKTPAKEIASSPEATSGAPVVVKSAPPMKDAQGRDLPADVRVMISQMNKAQSKFPTN